MLDPTRRPQMLIDGRWTDALDGATYGTVNPATEEPLGPVPHASPEDMRLAIAAARRAFDEGPWPRLPLRERYRIMHQLADLMEEHQEALSRVVVTETGTTAYLASMAGPIQILRETADLVLSEPFAESLAPFPFQDRMIQTQVLRQPVGVCGLLPTWNVPVMIAIRKIAPALAAGCTAVVKAPPQTPLTLLALAEIVAESDLPPGVLNFVTGDGIEASRELVRSPLVDQISFTGGLEAGRAIQAEAAGTVKRVVLELGGKSPNIVLDDVDLDVAARIAAPHAGFGAGQACSMLSRVLVPRPLADGFVERLVPLVAGMPVGDPTDPRTVVGPLIREERRAAVEKYVALGLEEGAELATGGRRPPHLERGYFYEPTVFVNARNDMRIAQEEIFGPVLTVIPYDTLDEAIRLAEDTVYGLQANITCRNVATGLEIARRLRNGAVSINGAVDGVRAPRGGFKQSGIGREVGKWALDDYLEYQALTYPI
ncbi:Acyl-CoA reductase [Pseudonocardia thermophila]|uniref:Acyl-CoA reductase n=1 Tax=Pseudonocardia thermophila TaxID=1848 RepID=A0A1M6UWK7_PSETH|nr:aldehyde dehydrogenase family protein [Pseudonocardia thermophila]SHK73495.1 Acyl-CoA reductase [Pseudonocardia thermophila]